MFKKIAGLLFSLALISSFTLGQTEPPAKALKLYKKGCDDRKDHLDRVQYLYDAIDIHESYVEAHAELSKLLYKLFKSDSSYGTECINVTQAWTELDPEGSYEGIYRIGTINYATNNDKEALSWYEKFLTESESSNSKRIARLRKNVEESLDLIRFSIEFRANEGTFTPIPLDNVNLSNDEYLPALSPDGSILFFTRAKNIKARGDVVSKRVEDLVWAKRNSGNSPFSRAEVLDYPFNQGPNYGGVSLSLDNRVLIIAVANPYPKNQQNIDLFTTTYKVDGDDGEGNFFYYWDELELLGPEINTIMGWESQPALSADGKELFFASARENSTPDFNGNPTMDIYVSRKDSMGNWGPSEKLPDVISTPYQEKAPFLHPDGKTLYFSSNREPSGGGYDLWVSRRDEAGNWSKPVNMGMPVNTMGDEHGLVVTASGAEAFFASRRSGTKGLDIMSFPVPDELRPEAIKVIHGVVDPTPPSEGTRLTLNYVQSKRAEEIELNYDDGSFAAIVNTSLNEDVILTVEGDDAAFEAVVVHQTEDEIQGNPTPELKIRAQKASDENAFELRDVQFATNSSEMDKAARLVLDVFAEYLLKNTQYEINIEGHTDNVGSPEKNLKLSDERARVVAEFLIDKGVSKNRIYAKGFGQTRPKASNDTEEGRRINRRTEFKVKI